MALAKGLLAEGYLGEKKELAQDPWPELYEAMRMGLIMQGKVSGIEKDKEGTKFVVFLGPIKGIIPESELGGSEGERPQIALGSTIAFKVKHCDRANNIVYLSRKDAIEEMSGRTWQELRNEAKELISLSKKVRELQAKLNPPANEGEEAAAKAEISDEEKEKIRQKIAELKEKMKEVGPVRTCVVKHVTRRGAYIDIGGVQGFIPRNEISWGYVEDPKDFLQRGDALDVKLIDISEEGITASIRLLLPDPWENVETKYKKDGAYVGKIVKEVTRGMIIELEPGVMGFAPHLPFGNPFPGSEVLFRVRKIDPEKRRIRGIVVKVLRRAG
ncbi:30S ribosomal protein S1 [Fervidicola ferrireducens]|uniref:30S ribosomal protein S1 n=1 Tax=Fervidicola ferrireducens TaxID=520764 RepID=A0A140L4M7_9FIRM|nr:S1 RNA-binding domain-containing protein [Fervidicola ferrireducens]KXG75502.1 30S ribosomal protein S1 [Fervidicola ferrireducens]